MKLLIVDDHEFNLKILRAQLEGAGHSVVQATNGVEALEMLERETVEGIISDILMPKMDGYRFCLEVRKREALSALPLVLYTSTYNAPADRALAESAGADGFIPKPSPTQVIIDALAAAPTRRRPPTEAPAAELEPPVLKQYNEMLIRTLEAKSEELEAAHDALKQVEARLSGLIETALDGIIAIDESYRIQLFNPAAGGMFGCAPADAIGRSFDDFVPEHFRSGHGAKIDSFGRGPITARPKGTMEVRGLRADGTEFPIEATISKLETGQGQLFTVFVRDISARHAAEEAARRSEAALKRAQELARLAHVISGPDGAFESWSENMPSLVGGSPENVPKSPRDCAAYVHPDDLAHFREQMNRIGRERVRGNLEYRVRRGAEWFDLYQDTDPLPDGRFFSTLQDVTPRKKALRKIEALNRVHAVLSGINTLIVRVSDREELFREACRIAVEEGKFPQAALCMVDETDRTAKLVAWEGAPDSFFQTRQDAMDADTIDGTGMVARAIQTAEPVVINDVASSAALFPGGVMSGSTRALTALPLLVDGKAVGVFLLNSPVPGFFDEEEMRLLRELAGDISFAMLHLRQAERVHHLANFDTLTGLPNRLLFAEQLGLQIQAPGQQMLAVILIDLERFRGVNATLGRAAGDQLLEQVAQRLKQVNPSLACLGADQFVMMVEQHSVAEIARTQEEIGKRCFSTPFMLSGQELRIGFCCGVSVFPGDGKDAEALLRNAETALRRAKAAMVSCVFYAPEMNTEASRALVIESKLRRAIEREEFILYYQPKVSIADNRIAGFEALIRWRDPEAGLVSPGEFIPILEETGLIGQVGEWALRQAMADHGRWRELGLAPPRIAVNVSPMQLRQGDFVARVAEAIAVEGVEALELEITESLIMDNVQANAAILAEIRKLGITIAIDDFGTGYCSLAYIAKLPVNALKIDRAFIVDITEGPEGMAIVSSIVGLAHALRLKVVAEGVETEEQGRLLRLLGCDKIQGYLYSRPVPPDEVPAMLRAGTLMPRDAKTP